MNWPDNVMAPGPGFDLKTITPPELQLLIGTYIDTVQSGGDVNGTTFNIQKWSQGKLLPFVLITFPDDFNVEQIDIPYSEA